MDFLFSKFCFPKLTSNIKVMEINLLLKIVDKNSKNNKLNRINIQIIKF